MPKNCSYYLGFWVITAGHCFRNVNPGDASSYTGIVTYGEHDLTVYERSELFRDIDYVVRHPSYTDVIFDYDYALVRVTAPVSFKTWNIQPICLPESCSASW